MRNLIKKKSVKFTEINILSLYNFFSMKRNSLFEKENTVCLHIQRKIKHDPL